jgi:hypothetical protein
VTKRRLDRTQKHPNRATAVKFGCGNKYITVENRLATALSPQAMEPPKVSGGKHPLPPFLPPFYLLRPTI